MNPKRRITRPIVVSLLVVIAGVAAFLFAKLTIPFHYAEGLIHQDAKSHILLLQKKGEHDPEELAVRYLLFGSDYHDHTPPRIQVSSKKTDADTIRVRVYDPSCEDDSISSEIWRIYLRKDKSQRWVPVRTEWSHRGRGRFGWTTEPTL